MRHQLRLFFIALQFFTRVPIPRWVGFEAEWLHHSARYFPAVGAFVGLVGACVFGVAHVLFGPVVAALLCIVATVLLTGGFHEDGFADTCDGLGGHVSRERALEIMKDSRIGAYGAMGLVLMLGLKAATLSALGAASVWTAVTALLMAHTGSRNATVLMIAWLPYAGDEAHAKAKPLAQRARLSDVLIACFTTVLLAGLIVFASSRGLAVGSWVAVLTSLLAATLMLLWCANWLKKRLGGITGDTLGATQQLVEVAMLLGWLGAIRWN
ncbi:MAG: adenosylcobinamide-GDP ribazoletransferase [Rhizobacter sp.]